MAKGDHLYVRYPFFTHHGIDLGNRTVVALSKKARIVERLSLEAFRDGRQLHVREHGACFDPDSVVARALLRVGKRGYDLFHSNCEHFATWCKTGKHRSEQVKDAEAKVVGVSHTGLGVGGGVGVVSASGPVSGLCAEGAVAGLDAVGGLVGAGPATGLAILAGIPAVVSVLTVRAVLKDDESLAAPERVARAAGRGASVGGAVVGTAGSVVAVAALGVPGLSAVGISTGLAALGCGSIALGLTTALAFPAALTLGAAYVSYRLFRGASQPT